MFMNNKKIGREAPWGHCYDMLKRCRPVTNRKVVGVAACVYLRCVCPEVRL